MGLQKTLKSQSNLEKKEQSWRYYAPWLQTILNVCVCLCVCVCVCVLSPQSFLTLSDPTDCSQPGSSVHGISQAKILEQVAISSSRDLPDLGINSHLLCLLAFH